MFTNRITESPIRTIGSPAMTINSPTNSINCNLCGTSGTSVKCDRCDSKTFCISCDDMYHRHPKRRFHLRKTINMQSNGDEIVSSSPLSRPFQVSSPSPSPTPSLSSINLHSESRLALYSSTPPPPPQSPLITNTIKSQSVNLQFQSQPLATEASHHHPSKMPIPPPRRKKKPQEDPNRSFLPQFGQTRVIQYQPGSNYRSVDHLNQPGQYFNDQQPNQQQFNQQKHQQFQQQQQNQQQRLNYNYLRPFDEEYRRGSLNIGTGSSNLSSANSSSLSSEQWSSEVGSSTGNPSLIPPALPLKKKWSQSLPRKNLSLMDLTSPYMNSNQYYNNGTGQPMTIQGQMFIKQQQQSQYPPMINHPTLPPHHPMNFGASPYHQQQQLSQHGQYPLGSVSLAHSMEDLGLDDGEDQTLTDEDFPDHGTLTRNQNRLSSMINRRNGSMKRSQSSFLVNQQWQQQQQSINQPYWMNQVYPMYSGGYPMVPSAGPPPLPPPLYNSNLRSSPSPSLRSLNLNRKKRSGSSNQSVRSSVARETSPSMMRKSSVSSSASSHHRSHHPHPNHSTSTSASQSRNKMFDQRSTSIPRSLTSSRYSMRASDSEDEDDYASQSEDDEENEEDDDRYSQASSLEPNKWWPCYACTFVNNPTSEICEMCGKSHPSRLKRICQRGKQSRPIKQEQQNNETRPYNETHESNQTNGRKSGSEVIITTDLIREQMEIEKELRRRLENERRVERENRRLERKEEKKRKQSLSSSLIDENDDNSNQVNQLIASTSSNTRKEPVVSLRVEAMRKVDDNNDYKMRFKTNNSNKDDDKVDYDDDDGQLNDSNKVLVKHSDKTIDDDDELGDWPDSVRKKDSIDKDQQNNNKKAGERSMSPLSSKNFKDIEETFEKLELEIDQIRNASNKRETIKKDEPKITKSETTIKVNDDDTLKQQEQQTQQSTNENKSDQQIKQNSQSIDSQSSITINSDQSKDLNHIPGSLEVNQVNKPVEIQSNETNQPLITPHSVVNQPVNQNPQLIAGSPLPLNLPAIYQQQQPGQMFPSYQNQYLMIGQQLTPINSGQSLVGAGQVFPGYDMNRFNRSNSFIGLNSPNCDIINHPLAVYAGSNYINNNSPSMYNLQMANLPMNQMSGHQTVTEQNPSFPNLRPDSNALSYLGQSSAFAGKFMSNENLSLENRTNQGNKQLSGSSTTVPSAQSQLQSGFQMFKLLRDAEKKGFTADDIEIALTFNSTAPLDWLDENWNNMVETVLTLSNNQLVQNEKKRLGKKYKLTAIDLVTTKDAKSGLRSTKGNIWQAIDKCVQRKEEDKSVDKKDVKSFSLDIEESGSGKSNMDAVPIALLTNQSIEHDHDQRLSHLLPESSSSSQRKEKNESTLELSRSSSSSGEYFSEPSDDNEDTQVRQLNIGTNVVDDDEDDEDDDEDDDRLLYIEVKYLDAVNETEEFEENITEEEEEVDETDDEDEENEELVRLRSDSVEDKGADNEEDEDDKEMEDYEKLRRSLEQRLSQLGINSIDGYIDDSDDGGEGDEREDEVKSNSQEEDEINEEFEILNRDDFDSNDSDKWSQQSREDHEIINNAKDTESQITVDQTFKSSSLLEITNNPEDTSLKENDEDNQSIVNINQQPEEPEPTSSSNNLSPKQKFEKNSKKKSVPLTNSEAECNNQQSKVNQILLPVNQITELPVIDKESLNPHFGYARSAYECELCAGSFHIRDMVSLISCTHKACINCLRQYFSVQIREASVFIITCPFCSEPVISPDDEDSICDYLSLLDQLVKALVTADLHELWQRKVRDKVLSKDPSFRWCTNCSSGFIASNPAAKTITCPDCQIVTCASCHKIWEDQHSGITCDQFTEWKRLNDPEYSDNQLELHLKQFGIDCPNCNFHYELSKGGCMHFHCVQCSHDFCGGCRQPFRLGSKCKISNWCDKLGLHAHHPRNCLFYLRDKEVNELRNLLDIHKIEYKYNDDKQNESRVCMVMEQKEYPEGLKDMPCGNNLETAGVCKQHYIEYLGGLIFEHGIDPIEIFTEDELIHVLRRDNLVLPIKKNGEDYRQILYDVIRKECPLIRDKPVK